MCRLEFSAAKTIFSLFLDQQRPKAWYINFSPLSGWCSVTRVAEIVCVKCTLSLCDLSF